MPLDDADRLLVERVRQGDPAAWSDFIARFEGRLLAFVESRLKSRGLSEDVVQETFLGFLISLPNYDDNTPLETFLFSIAAHKLTDVLRREGRRPTIPFSAPDGTASPSALPAKARLASSLVRSHERRGLEAQLLRDVLKSSIEDWIDQAQFERLKCMELLLVLGWPNKRVATELRISEQAVANHKHAVVARLKEAARRAGLSQADLHDFGLGS